MRKIGSLYLTPKTTLTFLEGSRFKFVALDRVEIASDFFPSGAIFFTWQSARSMLSGQEWENLPRLRVGNKYLLRLNYSAEEFSLTYRITFFDELNQAVAESYSQPTELEVTVPSYHHYQIEVLGHRPEREKKSKLIFNSLEFFDITTDDSPEIETISWQVETVSRPYFMAIVLDGGPNNEINSHRWQFPQEKQPGIIIHAVDMADLIGQFNGDNLDYFQKQIEKLRQKFQMTHEVCFVVGVGVNAPAAIRLAQAWQMTALIADPLVDHNFPDSLAPNEHPLVTNQMFDTKYALASAGDNLPVYLVLLKDDQRNQFLVQALDPIHTIDVIIPKHALDALIIGQSLDFELAAKFAIQRLIQPEWQD